MNLLKLLRDNADKAINNLRIENKDTESDMYLYDVIDDNFGISAIAFNKELTALKGKKVNLRINSPGGDVFAGRAMAIAIQNHGNVTAYIDGLAASAATCVALSAKEVHISDGAMFMLHNAWTFSIGNKNDLRATADLLDKIDGTIVNDYKKKTGLDEKEIVAMMDAETWLSAQEALDKGFVDYIFEGGSADNKWDLSAYANAPKVENAEEETNFINEEHRDRQAQRLKLVAHNAIGQRPRATVYQPPNGGFFMPERVYFERKYTMSKLAQMRELRNVKAQEVSALNDKYPADKRMSAEDAEKLDAGLAEIEAIDKEITRENRAAQLLVEANAETNLLNDVTKTPSAQKATKEEASAFRAFATGGMAALSDEQRRVMAARQTIDIRNAMSTTTTTEGGFTVATEYMKSLEQALKAFGGMRSVAKTIRTDSGAQMQFPTADATGEVGAILAQNATTPRVDTTFGNVALDVYKYTSNDIALPFELLQDSFIDIEAYIQGLLAIRLGRIQNTHFTIGTGTGQPRGAVVASGVGRVATAGATLTVSYDDLVRLEHSVDPAYRSAPNVGYMMNDASIAVIRQIKDTQGRPIFVPGYEQGTPGGAPDRLMGRPITVNQDMAVMAANAKSILFGDFSKYIIRDVMDLTLFRMTDSAFTRNGQVGFLAMQRVGGNLIDVSGASVKHYQNSAT